jgi:hypothetical protein
MESERIWLLYTAEKQERRKNLTKSTPPLRTIIAMESERIWLLYTAEKQERGKNLRKSTPPLRAIIVIVSIVILVLVCASPCFRVVPFPPIQESLRCWSRSRISRMFELK